MRKLAGNLKQSNTLLIFINQIRTKIGVMFGNPETTTGGNAMKPRLCWSRHPSYRRGERGRKRGG
ncbi:hypothetical protein ACLK11_15450 [Escherichia coli]